MTIYDLLSNDHQSVRDLLERLQQTTEGAEKTRENTFLKLKQELDVHTMFEEEVFYPAVAEAGQEAKKETDEAYEEHDEATSLLEDMAELDKTTEEWTARLEKLADALQQHIRHEEQEVFKLARQSLSDEQASQMAEQYRQAKQDMLKKSA